MRLFLAVNFNQQTKQNMLAVQQKLRALGRGRFSTPENLHLTLAFLGEIAPQRVDTVRRAMDCTDVQLMTLVFDHIGCFRRGGTDLWWIGIRENAALTALQKELSQNLRAQGFVLENRRFSPHITLVREFQQDNPADRLSLPVDPFVTQVGQISLMLSQRINGKLTYLELYGVGMDAGRV